MWEQFIEQFSSEMMFFVYACRVYLDGDYHEPSPDLLPAIPMVEEVKDCSCIIAWLLNWLLLHAKRPYTTLCL